jgi:hypothetical protein
MNLLKVIKSNQFALWVAVLSVIVQSFHSYTAFYNTSSLAGTGWGIAQAVLFAIVIDMAILFYTVRQRKDIAMYAAFVMVVINSYYYYQHLGLSFQFVFGCFLSLIIPTSVYFYSEEIKDDAPSITEEERDRVNKLKVAYDEAIRLRDLAFQSESNTKIALQNEIKTLRMDNFDLRKRMGGMSVDEINRARVGNYSQPEDKSLLNIQESEEKTFPVVSTDRPVK